MGKFLSKIQKNELLQELRLERGRKYADRIRVILLLDDGQTYKNIAKFLFLDEGSIANYRKRYKEGGLDALVNDFYQGRRSILSIKEIDILKRELERKVYPNTKEIIKFVKVKFKITYSRGGMTDLLHRLGFSFKKPKPVPGKAKKEEQQKFLNKLRGIMPHGPVYFGDSTHPMFNPVLNYGWIKKGEDFEIKTNSGRLRLNINGVIDINSLDVITRSSETTNKDSICELLHAIRQKNPEEKRIYLVLDNAPYNRAKKVKHLARQLKIRIYYLPPYSPNLNPIERLWKFMKKKVLANMYYESFSDFKKSVMEFFRGIRNHRFELETLITTNFQPPF
jgi:transposase